MSIPFILPMPLRSVFILIMSPSGDLGICAAYWRFSFLFSMRIFRPLSAVPACGYARYERGLVDNGCNIFL